MDVINIALTVGMTLVGAGGAWQKAKMGIAQNAKDIEDTKKLALKNTEDAKILAQQALVEFKTHIEQRFDGIERRVEETDRTTKDIYKLLISMKG